MKLNKSNPVEMKSISCDIRIKYKSEIVPRIGILDILEYNIRINVHSIRSIIERNVIINIHENIYASIETNLDKWKI